MMKKRNKTSKHQGHISEKSDSTSRRASGSSLGVIPEDGMLQKTTAPCAMLLCLQRTFSGKRCGGERL